MDKQAIVDYVAANTELCLYDGGVSWKEKVEHVLNVANHFECREDCERLATERDLLRKVVEAVRSTIPWMSSNGYRDIYLEQALTDLDTLGGDK